VPFLPLRDDFHPKRNQARQKLATLPTTRFEDLSSDVYFELARRYPEFQEDVCPFPSFLLYLHTQLTDTCTIPSPTNKHTQAQHTTTSPPSISPPPRLPPITSSLNSSSSSNNNNNNNNNNNPLRNGRISEDRPSTLGTAAAPSLSG
jgi:hypothetical protein